MATPEQQAAALGRRNTRYAERIEWYGREVRGNVRVTARQRIAIVAQLLRDKVVINLSTPVVKMAGGGRRDTNGRLTSRKVRVDPASRSKPGEFPRADTTRLMKSIFYEMEPATSGGSTAAAAIVGTPLDYGLILETRRDRSFLVRTLHDEAAALNVALGTGGSA